MEARILRCSLIFVSLFFSTGAVYQTRNFIVTAATSNEAKRVGEAAEEYRRDLAQFWLGQPLPPWGKPCKVRVKTGSLGAGGETRFQFVGKEVLNWNMFVQGSMERILDSVLPHEINHTIFACHYRRPLPRWADEGAATLFEHRSEQLKQLGLLNQVIKNDREFIAMDTLLRMKEYPKGMRAMLIMYAEGYALADFLVQQGGRQRYLKFLTDGHKIGWSKAIRTNYHHGGVASLEKNWKGWILAGMPRLYVPEGQNVASITQVVSSVQGAARPTILDLYNIAPTVRLQSPSATNTNHRKVDDPSFVSSRQDSPTTANLNTNPRRKRSSPENEGRQRTPVKAPQPRSPIASVDHLSSQQQNKDSRTRLGQPNQRPEQSAGSFTLQQNAGSVSADSAGPRSNFSRPVKSIPQQPFPANRLERYESTGFDQATELNHPARKYLSRERSVISGSIPQWASFPRQKELF